MKPNTEIVFYESKGNFTSKHALYKSNLKKSKLNESEEVRLILESLILTSISEDELGKDEIELNLDKIAMNYVNIVNSYKKHYEEERKVVFKNKFNVVQNPTINDYLKGVKISRGRPRKELSEDEKVVAYFGREYINIFGKDLNLSIVKKMDEKCDFVKMEGTHNYSLVLKDDKLYLRKVNL